MTRASFIVTFDNISHEWIDRFVQHRVADPRILRHERLVDETGGKLYFPTKGDELTKSFLEISQGS
jgi:hypothetical protein